MYKRAWSLPPGQEHIRPIRIEQKRDQAGRNECTYCGLITGRRNCVYSGTLLNAKGFVRLYGCSVTCTENMRNAIHKEIEGVAKITGDRRERLRALGAIDANDVLLLRIEGRTVAKAV